MVLGATTPIKHFLPFFSVVCTAMASKTVQRLSILSAVGAGTLLGSGGWHVLTAYREAEHTKAEEAAIQTVLKSISKSVAASESALISLETQQRQAERELAETDENLAALRARVQEAETKREALVDAGSRLAEDIRAETRILQGLITQRTDKETALVVSAKQREERMMKLAEAKEQWWVTKLLW